MLVELTPRRGAYLVAAALLLLSILTFQDYGYGIDESHGNTRANAVWNYYALGTVIPFKSWHFYGAFPDLVGLALQKLFPSLSVSAFHLTTSLFGVLGVLYVYKLCEDFIDPLTGFFAALFLALNPMWFGWIFANIKDIPYAALIFAAFYHCQAIVVLKRDRWPNYLGVTLFAGALAATKLIGVVMLGGFCAIALGVHLVRNRDMLEWPLLWRILRIAGAATAGSLLFLFVFWPQIYVYSPAQVMEALFKFTNFDNQNNSTALLSGVEYKISELPRYFMAVYLAISMPLFLLALVAASLPMLVWRPNRMVITCFAIIAFMLLYQAVSGATVYGGFRHFMFLVPFAMVLAAYAVTSIAKLGLWPARAAFAFAALGALFLVGKNYQLYPYQYAFYNSLVGGIGGAEGRYYMDVSRTAMTESLARLQLVAQIEDRTITVRGCTPHSNRTLFPRLKWVSKINDAEFLVTEIRKCPAKDYKRKALVDTIGREGAVFATTYKNLDFTP